MKRLRGFIAAGCLGLVAALAASAAGGSPGRHEVSFECRVRSSNDGCESRVECPAGTTLRAARAACNLEHGAVSDEQLARVEQDNIEVVRASDHVDEGKCWLGSSQVESGRVAVAAVAGLTGVVVGCQEHDKNGGDCVIRGSLYCQ